MEATVMQLAAAMLRRKVCADWPNCNCYSYLALWAKNLQDEEKLWDIEDLLIAEEMIFVTLACVEHRCPDKEIRTFAKQQLREPFWERQWSKAIREH
jgi:hypothetical protein